MLQLFKVREKNLTQLPEGNKQTSFYKIPIKFSDGYTTYAKTQLNNSTLSHIISRILPDFSISYVIDLILERHTEQTA